MQGKPSIPRVFQKSTMRSRLGIEKGDPGMGQVDGENEELRSLEVSSLYERAGRIGDCG